MQKFAHTEKGQSETKYKYANTNKVRKKKILIKNEKKLKYTKTKR